MSNRQYGKFPGSFDVKIIRRFMDEKAMESLLEDYKNACYRRARTRDVTPEDRKILKDYRAGMMLGELMEKYKKSRPTLLFAIALAAREN